MNLEWRLRAALWLLGRSGARRLHAMSPEEARNALRLQTVGPRASALHGRPRAMQEVRDLQAPGQAGPIGVRIYRPIGHRRDALVFFHGGGFVTGGIDVTDRQCRRIAADSHRIVCSVGYRLAPEHPFPAAIEDAMAGLRWVAAEAPTLGIDHGAIAVGGDSAGGTLAAAVTQLARDAGGPSIEAQVLIYAGLDASRTYPSEVELSDAPILNARDVAWSLEHYLSSEEERRDPRVSPMLSSLHGLPPALILVGEYDPLRDEGEAYAAALRAAGNEVVLRRYTRQPHGFLLLGRLSSQSGRAFRDIAAFLG
jgi:acetyl esterase